MSFIYLGGWVLDWLEIFRICDEEGWKMEDQAASHSASFVKQTFQTQKKLLI